MYRPIPIVEMLYNLTRKDPGSLRPRDVEIFENQLKGLRLVVCSLSLGVY